MFSSDMARARQKVLPISLFLVVAVHGCSKDKECSFNGLCVNSLCVCDPAWRHSDNGKEKCSVLNTLPFPNDYVPAYGGPRTSTVWQRQNITSWGGNILKDSKGTYHLYVSAMANGRGVSCHKSNFLYHII